MSIGNDGKGQTEMGQGLYPKPPDMTADDTQSLSDGELAYIIHNDVRLTGMPAWGKPGTPPSDADWEREENRLQIVSHRL